MFKKITIIAVLLFTFLVSLPASAAPVDNSSQIPEFNPFCWHRADCQKIRKQFGGSGTGDEGFITDDSVAPCVGGTGDQQWGRCLPAGKSKTEISFGGKSEFSNIGEFLVLMYKYLLSIASIVAVVVIIIAGAQWITSGGNSEAIGSAKKRIGGAIIGLFIAYMSYFVLNTINPALVNLRLPQVWLVKPLALTPEFCRDIAEGSNKDLKFSYYAGPADQGSPFNESKMDNKYNYEYSNTSNNFFYCGSRLLAEGGGKYTCKGDVCDLAENGDIQACYDNVGDRKHYQCGTARMVGNIVNSALVKSCDHFFVSGLIQSTGVSTPWGCPPVKDESLIAVCDTEQQMVLNFVNGKRYQFGDGKGESVGRYGIFATTKDVEDHASYCGSNSENFRGFVVEFEMYVEATAQGLNPLSGAKIDNRFHFVGRSDVGSSQGVDLGEGRTALYSLWKVDKKHLFSKEEVLRGATLNLDAGDISGSDGITSENKQYWEQQHR